MNNRGTGLLGDIRSKMVAEILALAMDDIRLPVNEILEITMMIRNGYPYIRIDYSKGKGLDIVDILLNMAFQFLRYGENLHIMSFADEFVHKISNGGHNTIGIGGI